MQSNGNDPFLSLLGIDLNENQIGSEEAAKMLTDYTLELIGEKSADNNRLIKTAQRFSHHHHLRHMIH